MAMDDAGIKEKPLPHVIHIEDQIADIPECKPPHDFIPLHQKGHIIEEDGWMNEPDGSFVDQRRVLEAGEGIMPQNVSVIPYLSTQAENPLARNMERLSAPYEVTIGSMKCRAHGSVDYRRCLRIQNGRGVVQNLCRCILPPKSAAKSYLTNCGPVRGRAKAGCCCS